MNDKFEISYASYGKSQFGALSWVRLAGADTVRDVTFRVVVEGGFLESFRVGDNHAVLPSETLRRHALAECVRHPDAMPENLAELIAARLLASNAAFDSVTVSGQVKSWRAVGAHSFTLDACLHNFELRQNRREEPQVTGGLTGLVILLTAGSSFTGFLRDELTDQDDSTDRPVLGSVEAGWTYRTPGLSAPVDMAAQVTTALADQTSNSIQQLITDAAARLLSTNDGLATIGLSFTSSAMTEVTAGIFSSADQAAGVTSVELVRGT